MDEFPELAVSPISSLLTYSKYAHHVILAYRRIREERLRMFLRSLDHVVDELTPEDRARFEAHINSETGAKVLAEFADTAVRTRSERVIAALAILYADSDHVLFSQDFKAGAALALEGLAERTIDAFHLILDSRNTMKHRFTTDRRYVVYYLSSVPGELPAGLADWSTDGADWVWLTSDLTSRGLLLPEVLGNTRAPVKDQLWSCAFSVGPATQLYAGLLTKARTYLRGAI